MRTRASRGSSRAGFSLLEMMTALAIVSVGIVGLLSILSGSLEGKRRLEDRKMADDLLRVKLAEYRATAQTIDSRSGRFEAPFERFSWRVEAKPTFLPGLFRLHIDVTWPGRQAERRISAETLTPQR